MIIFYLLRPGSSADAARAAAMRLCAAPASLSAFEMKPLAAALKRRRATLVIYRRAATAIILRQCARDNTHFRQRRYAGRHVEVMRRLLLIEYRALATMTGTRQRHSPLRHRDR